jgi:hypothetical protein
VKLGDVAAQERFGRLQGVVEPVREITVGALAANEELQKWLASQAGGERWAHWFHRRMQGRG